ncbi:unnamed protein product [Phytophthora lilii]|uniref:Unnamed protein product n=1 Tax=Phytophthora lilii TaxID=2077276 RepID=A0A9W6TLF9_9STRA|nr:unnamed protein product [Phytophthora lilii]
MSLCGTSAHAQEPIISQTQQASTPVYIAGSQLLTWWGQRADVEMALEQLGGVQQCPEGVNVRVDSELLEDEKLSVCRQDAAGFDVMQLLKPSQELLVPSEEQTMSFCSSEACAAWLSLAVEATWLPECRYRQSQTSVRSLVETLLRIREDFVAFSVDGGVVAPNGSLFREFYQLNQLANLVHTKEDVLHDVGSPVMQVARHLEAQENFSLLGSGDSPQLSAAVEPPGSASNAGSSTSPSNVASASSSSSSVSSSSSASNSDSVGDLPSGSDFNLNETAGFTGSGVGPHASSTATTRELTPSYAYVVGAWVLFNGSYFFLMRRK